MNLRELINEKRKELEALEQSAKSESCLKLGHDWIFSGGKNCGCVDGDCSVPVHKCSRCGDCDYGDNAEADRLKESCFQRINELEQAG